MPRKEGLTEGITAKERGGGMGFWTGVILGAAAGAVGAMFFSPRSPEEMRAELKNRQEDIKGKAEDITSRAKEMADEQKSKLQMAMDEAKSTAETTREDLINRYRQDTEGRAVS